MKWQNRMLWDKLAKANDEKLSSLSFEKRAPIVCAFLKHCVESLDQPNGPAWDIRVRAVVVEAVDALVGSSAQTRERIKIKQRLGQFLPKDEDDFMDGYLEYIVIAAQFAMSTESEDQLRALDYAYQAVHEWYVEAQVDGGDEHYLEHIEAASAECQEAMRYYTKLVDAAT
jgi:hypothetical protein